MATVPYHQEPPVSPRLFAGMKNLGCMMRLATPGRTDYVAARMLPAINMEETIGKSVGRRKISTRNTDYGLGLQTSLGQLFRSHVPKGVFRFRSYQEADQWLMDHLTRKLES